MSAGYIIGRVGDKAGLNPAMAAQRATLLKWLNEAARELYSQCDMVGSMTEQVFKINGDQTIALPSYVGQLRAAREFNSQIPWNINQMRPRYNVSNWQDMWRNYRIKGQRVLERAITNEAQVTVVCSAIEANPVTVTIAGSTTTASRVVEILLMDAVSKTSVNNWTHIDTFTKSANTSCNYTMYDVDGNHLTEIPNNSLAASYLIVDVSSLPWSNQSQSSQDHYVEILYKERLPQLSEDGDEFPAIGYDDILVDKCLQLWCEEKGDDKGALLYDTKATRTLARKMEDENRATQDCVAFVPNAHDTLLPRVGPGRRSRWYGYFGSGRNP